MPGGENMIQEIIDKFTIFLYNNNITQGEAAEKIECSQEHLSRVLRGQRTPSTKLLMKMEKYMEAHE